MATTEVSSSSTSEDKANPTARNAFLNFSFFRLDPKWRWLNEVGKEEASKEFANLLEVANTKIRVRLYSTLGLREDADLMLWMISDTLEKTQVMVSKVYSTVIGKYLTPSYVFLSMTRPSVYSSKVTPGFMSDEEPMKYCIVYPFIKSRDWYLLPFEERKKMMDTHIKVGRKFPQVKLNTTYSFGIDDQDFMLAFETADLSAFQELIIELRETEVSKYVIRDTPMIVCVYKGVEDILKSLG
jgi:chlorite dismutase